MSCDEWQTPPDLFEALDREFNFTLDPCTSQLHGRPFPGVEYFTPIEDGLSRSWRGAAVFMNPPYSRGNLDRWCAKAVLEAKTGAIVEGAA